MVWRNLSCCFLKVWGCDAYVKKFQVDKLEPKADKMHLHRTPKTVGYTSCLRFESNKGLFLESGPFSRKSFSRKVEWEDGGDLMRLLNRHFNKCVAGHRKLFLWHLHQLKWKLMILIMRLRIKSLPNLVG